MVTSYNVKEFLLRNGDKTVVIEMVLLSWVTIAHLLTIRWNALFV